MNLLSIDIVDPVSLSPREQLLSFIPLLILIGILLIIVLVIGLIIYKKKKTFSFTYENALIKNGMTEIRRIFNSENNTILDSKS